MVATINDSFTDFYNKEEIIKEENREQLQFCISSFIEQAIVAYNKKNKNTPKGIVIYRQGVSLQQKEFLKTEIQQIDTVCKTKNILYYYILVNFLWFNIINFLNNKKLTLKLPLNFLRNLIKGIQILDLAC